MDSISTSTLLIVLVILILLSAFFSSSETGLMSLNRYKLRHLAQTKHKAARRVEKLLARPTQANSDTCPTGLALSSRCSEAMMASR